MEISEKYKVESIPDNVVLYEKRYNKKKEVVWKPIGFHGNVAQALRNMVDKEIEGTGLVDFKTVVAKQEELYKLFSILKGDK